MKSRIRILLVDDHPIVRKGISSCLARHEHLLIVGEAGGGLEAVAKAKELQPDIVLLDIDLPQMSGLAVAEVLRKELPNVKVLILSMYQRAEYLPRILESGAQGYLLKGASPEELVKAIETITGGECYFSPEIARLAEELDRARSAGADTAHPLYRQYPEAWLESVARAQIETLDATLCRDPIYGQVPAFAAGERGVLDLLAVDLSGRLTVVELKASADLHLPLQALDYWVRVKWHLDRGEFSANGYFPGIELRGDAPRLLLVSPSLEFHPTTETLLGFFAPGIEVARVGLAVEWRKGLHVMFRLNGAQRPQ